MAPHQVVLQADVVVETLSTLLTHEGLLSCVETHVRAEVSDLVEGAIAHVAPERFFSGVDELMSFQHDNVSKSLPTGVAGVLIRTSVELNVAVAFVDVVESLRTVWTAVGLFFLRMGLLMLQFRRPVLEELQTVLAGVISIFMELTEMSFQADLSEESFPTLWTDYVFDRITFVIFSTHW